MLIQLYSSSSSSFNGTAYASKETSRIDNPIVSLVGSSVSSHFYDAIKDSEIVDGFLARFLVFQSEDFPEENDIKEPDITLSDELREKLLKLSTIKRTKFRTKRLRLSIYLNCFLI